MKKILRRCLSVILTVFCCASVGCNNQSTSSNSVDTGSEGLNLAVDANGKVKTIVKNGYSDYKIVIPEDYQQAELVAAEELQGFIEKSSYCTLPIVNDSQYKHDNSQTLISVGETTLLEAQNIDLSTESLGLMGIVLQTENNTLYVAGACADGTLSAVYEFLWYSVGFRAYAYDEVCYDILPQVPLYDFDIRYKPTVAYSQAGGKGVTQNNTLDLSRMRIMQGDKTVTGSVYGELSVHSLQQVLPADQYGKNDGWYGNGQVCQTNPEVVDQIVENIKPYILRNQTAPFFMLGHADTKATCNCTNCLEQAALYGGQGGLYIRFMNSISEKIDAWMADIDPERDVILIASAYYGYAKAPVVYDENGQPQPVDPSVVCRENVGVQFTPLETCWGCAINDPTCDTNVPTYRNLEAWSVLTNHLSIYSYDCLFTDYTAYFNSWSMYKGNAELWGEFDLEYWCVNVDRHNKTTPFWKLRRYIVSRLHWDCTEDLDQIIDDFMVNYYKVASAEMKEFYNLIRQRDEWCWGGVGKKEIIGIYDTSKETKEWWPIETMDKMLAVLSRALEKIDESNYDVVMKEKLRDRVRNEQVFIRYKRLKLYPNYYSAIEQEREQAEIQALFDEYGIIQASEAGAPLW